MWSELKRALLFTVSTMLLFGVAYPIVVWAVAQTAFPAQAEGSMVRGADGTVVGSSLIAQKFTAPSTSIRARPRSTTTRHRPAAATMDRPTPITSS
jgi:K+-transporting ATPase ATPase C chain